MRRAVLAVAGGLVLLLAGCGTPGEGEVGQLARDWLAAAAARDPARMCALLTPTAAAAVATGDETCEQAVADLDLPGDGTVGRVEVWSDEAQVRTGSDTLFLVRLADGWRVNGAGCTPRADRPYDCDVGG